MHKSLRAFSEFTVYLRAKRIARKHYDLEFLMKSKYAVGGRRGSVNLDARWPVSSRITVVHPENIVFHPDDLNNFQCFGNYYQAIGQISIGKGTYIAPNVGIITANHDPKDLDSHLKAIPVTIGEKCWIGMNSIILPGVILGNETIVGAGSVVTKSFPDGNCVIAGNPAAIIKEHDLKGENNERITAR